MGNKTSYSSIEGNDEPISITTSPGSFQSSSASSFGSPHHRHGKRLVLVALVVCAVATLVVVRILGRGTQETGAPIELEASPLKDTATTRACTFKECYASNCDHESAPYTCLFQNGGPHGGCSPTPWIEGTCEDSCDLTKCDALDIPDTVESCKGVVCGEKWCAGAQICPANVPYQCTSGSARFGCSTDRFQWTLRVDESTCSKCCDASKCA